MLDLNRVRGWARDTVLALRKESSGLCLELQPRGEVGLGVFLDRAHGQHERDARVQENAVVQGDDFRRPFSIHQTNPVTTAIDANAAITRNGFVWLEHAEKRARESGVVEARQADVSDRRVLDDARDSRNALRGRIRERVTEDRGHEQAVAPSVANLRAERTILVVESQHPKLFSGVFLAVEKSNQFRRATQVAVGRKSSGVIPRIIARRLEVAGAVQVE